MKIAEQRMYAYAAEAQPARPTHGGTAHIQPFDVIKNKMEENKNNNKIAIWVALIGATATIIVALINTKPKDESKVIVPQITINNQVENINRLNPDTGQVNNYQVKDNKKIFVSSPPQKEQSVITILTNPDNVDIYIEDKFIGKSNTDIKLSNGKHLIKFKKKGYNDYEDIIDLPKQSILSITLKQKNDD